MAAYIAGEFVNSYVLAKLKVWTAGKLLPLRMVASTAIGGAVDTLIVLTLAFAGVFPVNDLITMGLAVWMIKLAWEIVALPVSLPLIGWLKRAEGRDHFDRATDFNPFALRS